MTLIVARLNAGVILVVQFKAVYVHRDRTDCQARGAQDVHVDFLTALEFWWR